MKKVIAITGGIGSGKTTVSNILRDNGFTVLSADAVYNNLIKNKDFSREIYNVLGIPFDEQKGFDKKEISAVVFNNKQLLSKLDEFTHPKIMQNLFENSKKYDGIVFHEVPLLFEEGYEGRYDGVIVVIRNLSDRINSVVKRDGLTKEQVVQRIKNQYNYENIDKFKHTVIENDGVKENLERKVMAVISEISKNI